ncbi:MAG TPA: DUF58 domain-containing protein [Euzebyales bacterium]|nr:DUF58 domain-containing protein [Euzebyales bacterium]
MLPVVTPRLAALAAAGALLALVADASWVLGWNVLLGAAAIVDWHRALRPERLEVRRGTPAVLTQGATGPVTWTVANPGDRSLRVALADELVGGLGAPTRRVALTVPPRGRVRRSVELRPTRRGRFVLDRITVRVAGPWGLAARQRWRSEPAVITVYPMFRSQPQIELRLRRAQQLQLGERSVRQRGGGLDFDGLREYTVDDEVRQIDWAATARSPHAVVRTYRAERNQTVLVLVDCGRTMAALVGGAMAGATGDPGPIPRLEHAIEAAQGVTRLATGLGDRVGMIAFADRVLTTLPPRSQADQLRRVTLELAGIEARLVESDHHAAFVAALSRFPRRALLLVLTELANEAAVQTLLPALGLVRRRHLVVVGSVRDPLVESWRTGAADTVERTYRRAAAIRTLDQRAATAARLRAAGATVVDAVPGGLATGLADAYLDTKAAGRL